MTYFFVPGQFYGTHKILELELKLISAEPSFHWGHGGSESLATCPRPQSWLGAVDPGSQTRQASHYCVHLTLPSAREGGWGLRKHGFGFWCPPCLCPAWWLQLWLWPLYWSRVRVERQAPLIVCGDTGLRLCHPWNGRTRLHLLHRLCVHLCHLCSHFSSVPVQLVGKGSCHPSIVFPSSLTRG